jgi:hypothetical protein
MKFWARRIIRLSSVISNSGIHSDYMKSIFKSCFYIILFVFVFPLRSFGQCETDAVLDKCASGMGTYNYIKSFIADANPRKKANSEYSYVFSKGSTYIMIACNEKVIGGEMVINLYDRNHVLIASTWDEKSKKHYTDLEYPCSATGVYYIKATFDAAKSGCGMCILGFSKD